MPIVECPADTPPFPVFRETLGPIFRTRSGAGADPDPDRWDERFFVDQLRAVFARVVPGAVPIGFQTVVERNERTVCVTLNWQRDPETSFTGSGETEALAFLDAAAKAYAHPYFRKLLDGMEAGLA